MSVVSSSEMLVKRESRPPTKNSEHFSIISSAKSNHCFTVYSLLVKDFEIGTRNFTNQWVGVLVADKIGRKVRK